MRVVLISNSSDIQLQSRDLTRRGSDGVSCAGWKARTTTASERSAFTLIEILIVVIILGILSTIMIPQFSNATTVTRESTLHEDLRYLRTQIGCFKYQHRDITPGYPGGDVTATPDEATFLDQMTRYSDELCNTSTIPSSSLRYGPYLTQMPTNPLNGKAGVWIVTGTTMPPADATKPFGWIYNPELQKIMVNQPGADTSGVTFASY